MERKHKRLVIWNKPTKFVLAAGICATFAGCYGVYEGKAEKNLKLADDYKAGEFDESKSLYDSAKSAFTSGQSAKASGQSGEAKTQMKQAVDLSEQAVEQSKTRFADKALTQAQADLKVATINEVQRENPSRYEEAQATLTESEDLYNKQKPEKSIDASRKVTNTVNQLLANKKNIAENLQGELKNRLEQLIKAQGETYVPQAVESLKEEIRIITEKIEKDRDYKEAARRATGAITDADNNITESKKRNSENDLTQLDNKIAEALAEEAPIHVPDQLKVVQDRFEALLASYHKQQYNVVLSEVGNLRPRIDELITMSRIEATKDRIRRVDEGILNWQAQQVEKFLPGRIAEMITLRDSAKEKFANNDYASAQKDSNDAITAERRISEAFDGVASQHLQDGKIVVDAADQSYQRMIQVFSTPQTAIDSRLQSRYQVESSELRGKLSNSQEIINTADQNRKAQQYLRAIEQAAQAKTTASDVSEGTYKLVAENAVLGIQDQISVLERQGAREYAPNELSDVQNLISEVQKLIASKQNKQAAEVAAKTRASLENVKQEIARQARTNVEQLGRLIERVEGGAGSAPAAGGMNRPGVLQRHAMGDHETPGGSDLNNKEAMLSEVVDLAGSLPESEPVMLAQTWISTPNSTASGGSAGDTNSNRDLPSGTFMQSQSPSTVFTGTGQPTGAPIGNRAEPVVDANGNSISNGTTAYEAPTAPGPFVAVSESTGNNVAPDSPVATVNTIKARIDEILLDNQRAKDLETHRPEAVEAARQKLVESSNAITAEDYVRATDLAKDAQRLIFEADRDSAKKASEVDLQAAADRINLANAGGAMMFAPAELTEARRLYDQGKEFTKTGDYHEARKIAARALVAAEEARSYNVNKARDISSLSTRYGGWKTSHPALTESNRLSDIADDLLRNPATAAQGQEVAKQAVTLSQIALDSARDYTYQERLDNIYKALNTALRAGANYFNVPEVKRLIAEIAIAREQYCTRNFDAVELKLQDIEARLARVIETTPLVLEQNLVETTEKLNALIAAGAEDYMAQEVDNVKTMMNQSVVAFRKHAYEASYIQIRDAMALTDKIENRLQEQVYFDSVTELFAQMDQLFHKFSQVLDYDPAFVKKLMNTQYGQPRALDLSTRINPNDFKDEMTNLYLRTIHLKAPKSQEANHTNVILAMKNAKIASDNFQKLYVLDQVSMPDAYDIIDTAYNQIKTAKKLRADIQYNVIEPQARKKVILADKIVNY